jgi:hypothetical protein
MPRRRLAAVISPAAALLSFVALWILVTLIVAPTPGHMLGYVVAQGIIFGLPFTYGVAAVTLYLPFRMLLADGRLTPRTVYSGAFLTGVLSLVALAIVLSIFDKPVGWLPAGVVSLLGGIAGLIGGVVFVRVGGPFELARRAR